MSKWRKKDVVVVKSLRCLPHPQTPMAFNAFNFSSAAASSASPASSSPTARRRGAGAPGASMDGGSAPRPAWPPAAAAGPNGLHAAAAAATNGPAPTTTAQTSSSTTAPSFSSVLGATNGPNGIGPGLEGTEDPTRPFVYSREYLLKLYERQRHASAHRPVELARHELATRDSARPLWLAQDMGEREKDLFASNLHPPNLRNGARQPAAARTDPANGVPAAADGGAPAAARATRRTRTGLGSASGSIGITGGVLDGMVPGGGGASSTTQQPTLARKDSAKDLGARRTATRASPPTEEAQSNGMPADKVNGHVEDVPAPQARAPPPAFPPGLAPPPRAGPPESNTWNYRDPNSIIQGPFEAAQMHDWFTQGFFSGDLAVKRAQEHEFETLDKLIARTGDSDTPFLSAPLQPTAPPLPAPLPSQSPSLLFAQAQGQAQAQAVAQSRSASWHEPFGASVDAFGRPLPAQPPISTSPVSLLHRPASALDPWAPRESPSLWDHRATPPLANAFAQPAYQPTLDAFGCPTGTTPPRAPSHYAPTSRTASLDAAEWLRQPQSLAPGTPPIIAAEEAPKEDASVAAARKESTPQPIAPPPRQETAVPDVTSALADAKIDEEPTPTEVSVATSAETTQSAKRRRGGRGGANREKPASQEPAQEQVQEPAEEEEPVKEEPAAPKQAPWVKEDKESTGPSLREIQEAEEREAEKRRALERQQSLRAQALAAQRADSERLPTSSTWGTLDAPRLASPGSAKSPWAARSPAPANAGKSLKDIQEEEEAQRRQAAAARNAIPASQRAYAGSVSADARAPTGPGWTTVAVKPPPQPKAAPAMRAAIPGLPASAAPQPAARAPPPKTVVAPAPKPAVAPQPRAPVIRSVSIGGSAAPKPEPDAPPQPSPDFVKWCKTALKGLHVPFDEFLQMLLSFPLEASPDVLEIISDSVYANSSTLDGRRFANDFVARRKADVAARTPAPVAAKSNNMADVVRAQPQQSSEWNVKVSGGKTKRR